MKKIIFIALAAILAGFAISCQKEESVSEKTDTVQYTFNITVNDQVGFDSEASTKGGSSEKYKTGWENNDKIFLFFKPTRESLLEDRYATLTYNGSSWDGTVSSGSSSLGEEGTLSAVYVYNLGDVTPEFSTDKWTIATGNTFYNCLTVSYTVSGNEISASLDLKAPENFVRFYVENATGALTCDKVKGWKDIAIGGNLAVSNVTCTGYMDGDANTGDNNVMEYYGRIINAGTSLENVDCEFSVVKNGKVYERTATPSTAARSFKMTVATDKWTEAKGKLPGLFKISKGVDDTDGTEDDVLVRFSQGNLWYGPATTGATATFNFEENQYDYSLGTYHEGGIESYYDWNSDHISHFFWSKTASVAYAKEYSDEENDDDVFFTNADNFEVNVDGVNQTGWRTLYMNEWKYLLNNRRVNGGEGDGYSYSYGISYNGKMGLVLYPDNYDGALVSGTVSALPEGVVFLPAAGFRQGSFDPFGVYEVNCGLYWSSTTFKIGVNAHCIVRFDDTVAGCDSWERSSGLSIRLITDVK